MVVFDGLFGSVVFIVDLTIFVLVEDVFDILKLVSVEGDLDSIISFKVWSFGSVEEIWELSLLSNERV